MCTQSVDSEYLYNKKRLPPEHWLTSPLHHIIQCSSVQFSSVTQLCPTLCDPMNRSTPGLPVHHQLPEFTQTRVHWVSDAIRPSHPLSSPSPPALNLSCTLNKTILLHLLYIIYIYRNLWDQRKAKGNAA